MRQLGCLMVLLGTLLLPQLSQAQSWRVTGTVSKAWSKTLAKRHTANVLGHRNFQLQHLYSGRDALVTEHFKAVPKRGARFTPFAVHVQRAKIEPAIIAPRGTSRVSFSSLQGYAGGLKKR
jgi:hypothetical protein